MKIRIIFWDIDGTLTDDQIHKAKHRLLAKKAMYEISDSESIQLNGVDDKNTYAYLSSKSAAFLYIYPRVEDYILACRNFFELHAANFRSKYRVKARKGAVALVHELSNLGIYQACVTSAPDWQAERNIAALGISNKLQFIQMLTDDIQPKPFPDLYKVAFERMAKLFIHLKKSEILVIEDSISGVTAAQAAGLQVIHCRMTELAPSSDRTTLHAFNIEQVKEIMIKKFDMALTSSMLSKGSPLNKEQRQNASTTTSKIFQSEKTFTLFFQQSILQIFKNKPYDTYCGFKRGFLVGKRF